VNNLPSSEKKAQRKKGLFNVKYNIESNIF
jgi:hypothetical protein